MSPTSSQLPVPLRKRQLWRMRRKRAVRKYQHASWLDLLLDIIAPRRAKQRKMVRRLRKKQTADAEQDALKSIACMCSVVALHALLAKQRGNISAKGFLEFRCLFPIGDMESKNLRYLFKLAWQDTQAADYHMLHITALYPEQRHIYQRIVEGLARQMLAGDSPTRQEILWLEKIAAAFGLTRINVRQILTRAEKPMEASPYWLFDVPKNASKKRIQQAYKKMMLRCHPDRVHGAAYPETSAAAEKLSTAATLAYAGLKRGKYRKLKLSA